MCSRRSSRTTPSCLSDLIVAAAADLCGNLVDDHVEPDIGVQDVRVGSHQPCLKNRTHPEAEDERVNRIAAPDQTRMSTCDTVDGSHPSAWLCRLLEDFGVQECALTSGYGYKQTLAGLKTTSASLPGADLPGGVAEGPFLTQSGQNRRAGLSDVGKTVRRVVGSGGRGRNGLPPPVCDSVLTKANELSGELPVIRRAFDKIATTLRS